MSEAHSDAPGLPPAEDSAASDEARELPPVEGDLAPQLPGQADDAAEPFRIAFAVGVTVTKWTRIWQERHPDVPLVVFRSEPGEQTAVLVDGGADVSFVRLPIDTEAFSAIALYTEVQVVGVAKDHPVSAFDSVTVADLADEHLLQEPDTVPEWRDVAIEIAEGSRRPLLGIRDLDDAVGQVAAGVGIVIVPHAISRMHGRKDVVFRPVTDVAETQVSLAWPQGSDSPLVEEFIGIVRGRSAASSRTGSGVGAAAGGQSGAGDEKPVKKIGPVAKAKAKARAAAEAEAAASSKKGGAAAKRPGAKPAKPVKKKQSDQANAAQARRRKFGGKR
ncbi:LysR family substrate-binding domain-containing protein [Subtercola sp. PAMC28395]|uniref:LysR family substrate-binding domain-containing protein n=1 Tax=Subtercola sp. PAMC28395 TaxID=2846775 RepID=UPI001C0C2656|nr:LysR family substrate-binding domain-containing protein [Subtercola sp. PAMC28395]QWT24104.1 LysR family substrate-binding domain-containing protein [Subtercola sp. PAMC28395]